MAKQYQVEAEDLREGTMIFVRGKTINSRIASVLHGQELDEDNQRKAANNMLATDYPHVSISLAHAEVQMKDPANPSPEELFVSERRFTSKKYPGRGLCYTAIGKANKVIEKTTLPQVFIPSENTPGTYDPDLSCRDSPRTSTSPLC